MADDKRIITTQCMLAIEAASKAVAARQQGTREAENFEDSTIKLKAHYARERGIQPPEVTLELLRKRYDERRK